MFKVPNLLDAADPKQAQLDSGDLDIITSLNGVLTGCAVTAATDMSIDIEAGIALIDGLAINVDGTSIEISAADSTDDRFDLVVVLDDGTIAPVEGLPEATPVYPTIPDNSAVLAAILIKANVTEIVSDNIVDKRKSVIKRGVAGNTVTIAASDTRQKVGADFVCSGTSDQVVIRQALDYLSDNEIKGTVKLLEGTFVFDGALHIMPEHSGLALVGSGKDRTTIRGNPGDGIPFISLSQDVTVISGEHDSEPDLTVVDDFNRANETPLSQDGNWQSVWSPTFGDSLGYAPNVFDLISNRAQARIDDPDTLGYSEAAMCRTDVDEENVDVAIRFKQSGSYGAYNPSIVARVKDPGTTDAMAYVIYTYAGVTYGVIDQLFLYVVGEAVGYQLGVNCEIPESLGPLQENDWIRYRLVDDRHSVFIRRGDDGEWMRCYWFNPDTDAFDLPYFTDSIITGSGSIGIAAEDDTTLPQLGTLDRFAWGPVTDGGTPDPVTTEPEILDGFELRDFFVDGQDWINSTTSSFSSTQFGAILDKGLGSCRRLTFDNLRINTADINQSGSGIVAHQIDESATPNEDWVVKNCEMKLDGKAAYGVKFQKRTNGVQVRNNKIVNLKAATSPTAGDGAYNHIAIYGGSSNIVVEGNYVEGDGSHSCIAFSPAFRGVIANNVVVQNTPQVNEAGIEVQYKLGHSDDLYTSHDVTVIGNVVIGPSWGIVVNQEVVSVDPDFDPYNILITGNTLNSCSTRDIILKNGKSISAFGNNHINSLEEIDIDSDAVTAGASGDMGLGPLIGRSRPDAEPTGSDRSRDIIQGYKSDGTLVFYLLSSGRIVSFADEVQFNGEPGASSSFLKANSGNLVFFASDGAILFQIDNDTKFEVFEDSVLFRYPITVPEPDSTPITPSVEGGTLFFDSGVLKAKLTDGSVITFATV